MRDTLQPGLEHQLNFRVPTTKTVPSLYPEAAEFQAMPQVFATGFLVGLLEWTCVQLVNPHLDWPDEQTLGTHIDVSHEAGTPPGLQITATARLLEVDRRRLTFAVEAHDGVDLISRGTHERAVIDAARFTASIQAKADTAGSAEPAVGSARADNAAG